MEDEKRYIIKRDEIPRDQLDSFDEFVFSRGCPVIDGEICYWRADYMEFKYGTRSLKLYDQLHVKSKP